MKETSYDATSSWWAAAAVGGRMWMCVYGGRGIYGEEEEKKRVILRMLFFDVYFESELYKNHVRIDRIKLTLIEVTSLIVYN